LRLARTVFSRHYRGRGRRSLRARLRVVELDEYLSRANERTFAHRNPHDTAPDLRAEIALIAFESATYRQLRRWRSREKCAYNEDDDHEQRHQNHRSGD
jgi:hypothetical protein